MDQPTRVITIHPAGGRVTVTFAGEVIADTTRALELREETHEPVLYIPMDDVRMDLLAETAHTSHCPWKGDARYWSIRAGGREAKDAAWGYDTPLPAVKQIAGHLAFYTDRVDAIEFGKV